MIKKTRWKFIFTTMLMLTVVIAVFVAAVIAVNVGNSRNDTQMKLNGAFRPASPDSDRANDAFCVEYNGTTETYVFPQEALRVYSEQELEELCARAMESGQEQGNFDNLYFQIRHRNDLTFVAFYDRTTEEQMLLTFAVSVILIGVGALAVLFFAVYGLSFLVIRQVERSFEQQKRFISDVSHELKTPLTIINANADVLKAEIGDSEWVDNIVSQTRRMNVLVNDMLNLSRLDEQSGNVVKTEFDLSRAVSNSVLAFEALAYESGKTFTANFAQNVNYVGVEEDVKRLCALLCDNAVKYCETFVTVTFGLHGSRPYLQIVNDGCAVDNDEKEKIFERFYRAESSRARSTGGSGLGLSVVKALADRNKWKIVLNCQKGGNMDITVEM